MASIREKTKFQLRMEQIDIRKIDVKNATGATYQAVCNWCNGSNKPSAKYIESLEDVMQDKFRNLF